MAEGKPQAQSLAIAYSVKRKNKRKKMAQGGEVTAKAESRPMPDTTANDAHSVSHNSAKKAPSQDQWTDQPTVRQAQKPSHTRLSQPKMVGSDAFSVRLRDMHEDEADMMGKLPPQPYAKGGHVSMEMGEGPEEDNLQHPAGLEEDNDMMAPAESEYMAGYFAEGGEVEYDEYGYPKKTPQATPTPKPKNEFHDTGKGIEDTSGFQKKAFGGSVEDEMEDEHHDSVAAAIMAKREREMPSSDSDEDHMMAEGGEVDIDENAEEQPNMFYRRNQEALKENYDSDMDSLTEPTDSNEMADPREENEENEHDMIDRIRSKANVRRQFR